MRLVHLSWKDKIWELLDDPRHPNREKDGEVDGSHLVNTRSEFLEMGTLKKSVLSRKFGLKRKLLLWLLLMVVVGTTCNGKMAYVRMGEP